MSSSGSKEYEQYPEEESDEELICDDEFDANEGEEYEEEDFEDTEQQFLEEKTIDELKEMLQESIDALDFANARIIRIVLDKKTMIKEKSEFQDASSFHTQSTFDVVETFNKIIIRAEQERDQEKEKTERKFFSKEKENRTSFTDKFDALQRIHLNQLKDLETKLMEYRLKMPEKSQKCIELEQKAKIQASDGNFDLAEEINDDIIQISAQEREKSQKRFQALCSQKVNSLLDSQNADLRSLQSKMERTISSLAKAKKQKIKEVESAFISSVERQYKSLVSNVKNPHKAPKVPSNEINSVLTALKEEYSAFKQKVDPHKQSEKRDSDSYSRVSRKSLGFGELKSFKRAAFDGDSYAASIAAEDDEIRSFLSSLPTRNRRSGAASTVHESTDDFDED